MGQFTDRVGEAHKNNKGENFTIVRYKDNKDVDIQFEDGTLTLNRNYSEVISGGIRNPNTPSIYGVGYISEGVYKTTLNGKRTKHYVSWRGMLCRCYSDNFLERYPTYKDVTVCEDWHNFQNFAKWHEENYKPHMQGWCLDKDILKKTNKVYSPETCCFVPNEINNLVIRHNTHRGEFPIGVTYKSGGFRACLNTKDGSKHIGRFKNSEDAFQAYKTAKEKYVKEVADKWKEQITEQTYQALYNYKVETTD